MKIKPMKFKNIVLFLLIPSVLLFHSSAKADRGLRCQGRLVTIGDTKAEVLEMCGKPDQVKQWEEGHDRNFSQIYDYEKERYIAPKLIEGPILMERWTYDMGSNKFIRYLYFQNGELIKIETGEKGSH